MTWRTLVWRYALFAVIATIANLGTQRFVLSVGEGTAIFTAAVGVGTLMGLVVKYILDKRWIFQDHCIGLKAHSQKFTLYTAMGLVTTAIFWGSETLFWILWQTDVMREIGAILGLSVGYVIKYNLDRRFVFADNTLEAQT